MPRDKMILCRPKARQNRVGVPVIRKLLISAVAATAALGLAWSAGAATLHVTDVGTYNPWDYESVGIHTEPATGIIFNSATDNLLVFCVDIEHNINVGGGKNYLFTWGTLDTRGDGASIDALTSNRIGHLADLGKSIRTSGDGDIANDLSAVQGAIWSLEYLDPFNVDASKRTRAISGNSEIDSEITSDITWAQGFNGTTRARALISHVGTEPGTQNMVTGGVPEPTTWALMLAGFGLAGAALRRPQTYRLVEIAADGATASETFRADDDQSALAQALGVAEGLAIEVWRGRSLIHSCEGRRTAAA